jgi:hypothetical protein
MNWIWIVAAAAMFAVSAAEDDDFAWLAGLIFIALAYLDRIHAAVYASEEDRTRG